MPNIAILNPAGVPIGTRWVSKHSPEAQPSKRALLKRKAQAEHREAVRNAGPVAAKYQHSVSRGWAALATALERRAA